MDDAIAAGLARQTLLARTRTRLPLGREGTLLRRRLREASPSTRPHLANAWAAALRTLHLHGWGTEDPVTAALVNARDRVVFLPDLVWPLGTLVAARPVLAYSDLHEALNWLSAAGADEDITRPLTEGAPPWADWPEPPGPGATALIGPPMLTAAAAAAAGLPALPATELTTPEGRRWAARQLRDGQAFAVPIAHRSWLASLPLVPDRVVRMDGADGAVLRLEDSHARALGVTPEASIRPTWPSLNVEVDARAAEDAALVVDDQERARLLAEALLAAHADDPEADPVEGRSEPALVEALSLAREAGDRRLTAAATYSLARLSLGAPEQRRQGATRGLLQEAERLARAVGDDDTALVAAATVRLLERIDARATSLPLTHPRDRVSPQATAWALVWDAVSTLPVERAFGRHEIDLANVALLSDDPSLAAFWVELTGQHAIIYGREAAGERALQRAESVRIAPRARAVLGAWRGLLAARRGAENTAREMLVTLGEQLATLELGPWTRRAAAHGAVAALVLGLDGLADHLASFAPDASVIDTLRSVNPLPPDLPLWLLQLVTEQRLDGDEPPLRQARKMLSDRLGAYDAPARPPGAALSLGLAHHAVHEPAAARDALSIATVDSEPHIERAALGALVPLLEASSAGSDEAIAAAYRLRRLDARTPARPSSISRAAPSATFESAAERAADAVARVGDGIDPWPAALSAIVGDFAGDPPSRADAVAGLILEERPEGWVVRTAGGQDRWLRSEPRSMAPASLRFASLLARLVPPPPPAPPPADADHAWAKDIDTKLSRGDVTLEAAVIVPFRRHKLTVGQLRLLVHLGLTATNGLYRAVARRWGVPDGDYQRVMDFMRRAGAALDFRPYRRGVVDPPELRGNDEP